MDRWYGPHPEIILQFGDYLINESFSNTGSVLTPTMMLNSLKLIVLPGHGAELPFVFHAAALPQFNHTQDEVVLSGNMVQYWTNFARYGNPNQFQLQKNAVSYKSCAC